MDAVTQEITGRFYSKAEKPKTDFVHISPLVDVIITHLLELCKSKTQHTGRNVHACQILIEDLKKGGRAPPLSLVLSFNGCFQLFFSSIPKLCDFNTGNKSTFHMETLPFPVHWAPQQKASNGKALVAHCTCCTLCCPSVVFLAFNRSHLVDQVSWLNE